MRCPPARIFSPEWLTDLPNDLQMGLDSSRGPATRSSVSGVGGTSRLRPLFYAPPDDPAESGFLINGPAVAVYR